MAREGKAPAFQFYAGDWLADERVRLMTLAERGAYIDLLAFAWREGSIPDDAAKCARLLLCSPKEMAATWEAVRPMFVAGEPGRLVSERMEQERRQLQEYAAAQAAKANKRWSGNAAASTAAHAPAYATASAPAVPVECSASASSTASATAEEKTCADKPRPPHGRKRGTREPPPELPGCTVTRAEVTAAIAAASAGRYVDSPPPVGCVFKLDPLRARPDALAVARRIGEWLAAGGDAWRGTLDGRHLADLDAWAAQAQAWDGGPVASRPSPPAPVSDIRRGQAPILRRGGAA